MVTLNQEIINEARKRGYSDLDIYNRYKNITLKSNLSEQDLQNLIRTRNIDLKIPTEKPKRIEAKEFIPFPYPTEPTLVQKARERVKKLRVERAPVPPVARGFVPPPEYKIPAVPKEPERKITLERFGLERPEVAEPIGASKDFTATVKSVWELAKTPAQKVREGGRILVDQIYKLAGPEFEDVITPDYKWRFWSNFARDLGKESFTALFDFAAVYVEPETLILSGIFKGVLKIPFVKKILLKNIRLFEKTIVGTVPRDQISKVVGRPMSEAEFSKILRELPKAKKEALIDLVSRTRDPIVAIKTEPNYIKAIRKIFGLERIIPEVRGVMPPERVGVRYPVAEPIVPALPPPAAPAPPPKAVPGVAVPPKPPITPAVVKPVPPIAPAKPLVPTKVAMVKNLFDLGYSTEQIQTMTPEDVKTIYNQQIPVSEAKITPTGKVKAPVPKVIKPEAIKVKKGVKKKIAEPIELMALEVPKKPTLPILGDIIFDKNRIYTTDLESYLIYETDKDVGKFAMPATIKAKLEDIKKVSEDMVRTPEGEFRIDKREDAPDLPIPKNKQIESTVSAPEFISTLSRVRPMASTDETRYVLNSVFLEFNKDNIQMTATDGKRMITQSLKADTLVKKPFSAMVPSGQVDKILKIFSKVKPDKFKIEIFQEKGKPVIVQLKADKYTFGTVTIEGKYPEYQKATPKKQKIYYEIDRNTFYGALRTVPKEFTEPIIMSFTKEGLNLRIVQKNVGEYKKTIPYKITSKPPQHDQVIMPMRTEIEMPKGINNLVIGRDYLQDSLKSVVTDKLVLGYDAPLSAITISNQKIVPKVPVKEIKPIEKVEVKPPVKEVRVITPEEKRVLGGLKRTVHILQRKYDMTPEEAQQLKIDTIGRPSVEYATKEELRKVVSTLRQFGKKRTLQRWLKRQAVTFKLIVKGKEHNFRRFLKNYFHKNKVENLTVDELEIAIKYIGQLQVNYKGIVTIPQVFKPLLFPQHKTLLKKHKVGLGRYIFEPYEYLKTFDIDDNISNIRELTKMVKEKQKTPQEIANLIHKVLPLEGNDLRYLEKFGLYKNIGAPLEKAGFEYRRLLDEYKTVVDKWNEAAKETPEGKELMFQASDSPFTEELKSALKPSQVKAVEEWFEWRNYFKKKFKIESSISNYIHHLIEETLRPYLKDKYPFPEELAAFMEYIIPNQIWVSFLKERVGFPFIKRDFIAATSAYFRMAARKIAYDDALKEVNDKLRVLKLSNSKLEKYIRDFIQLNILGRQTTQAQEISNTANRILKDLFGEKTISLPPEVVAQIKITNSSLPTEFQVPKFSITPRSINRFISDVKLVSYLSLIALNLRTAFVNLTQVTLGVAKMHLPVPQRMYLLLKNQIWTLDKLFRPSFWKKMNEQGILEEMQRWMETDKKGHQFVSEFVGYSMMNMKVTEFINRVTSSKLGIEQKRILARKGRLSITELDKLIEKDPGFLEEAKVLDKEFSDMVNYLYGADYTPSIFMTPLGRIAYHLNSFSLKYGNRVYLFAKEAQLGSDIIKFNKVMRKAGWTEDDMIKFVQGLPPQKKSNFVFFLMAISALGLMFGSIDYFTLKAIGVGMNPIASMLAHLVAGDLKEAGKEFLKTMEPFRGARRRIARIKKTGIKGLWQIGKIEEEERAVRKERERRTR